MAWPWHRDEERRSQNWRDGVARTAGSEEEPASRPCRIQISPAPALPVWAPLSHTSMPGKSQKRKPRLLCGYSTSGLQMALGRSTYWLRASTSLSGEWGNKSLEPCFVLQGSQ